MRKIISLLISGVMLATLAGCSNADSSSIQAKNDGTVTISWWAFPTFAQLGADDEEGTYEKSVIEAFEKVNPDINVELKMIDFTSGPDKIQIAINNNSACDVLFDAPGRIISYAKADKLVSLEDMFTVDFVADVDNDTLLQACKSGDTPYMYPISSAPFYMAFNKAMAEEAGVADLIKEGWTTDDFTTVITALSNEGYVAGSLFCADQGGDQGTRAFAANLFDCTITNPELTEYTFNQHNAVNSLEYIKQAVDKGYILNGEQYNGTDAITNFANGRASFSLLWGPNQQKSNQALLDENNIETIEVPYPSQDGKAQLEYLVNGFCVFDNGDDEKIAASKKLIEFICDDETWGKQSVIQTGCIPVRNSYGDLYESEEMKKISAWTVYYSDYYNTIDGFSDMRPLWYKMLNTLLNGEKTPAQCAADFNERANATISD